MDPLLALDERQTQAQGSKGHGNWWEKLQRGISAHGDLQLMIVTRSRGCLEARATIWSSLECATWTSLLAHATLQDNKKMRFLGKNRKLLRGKSAWVKNGSAGRERALGEEQGAKMER
jgi:hypothetical protein